VSAGVVPEPKSEVA